MDTKENNKIQERVQTLLDGRKIHTWGASIGLKKTVLSRLAQGILPSADKLTPVVRAENTSLSWLIEGKGAPFLVQHCFDDEECADYVAALLDERWQNAWLLTDENQIAIVMTQPGRYTLADTTYLYTIIEVVVGHIGTSTLNLISNSQRIDNVFYARISSKQMRSIRRGEYGTWKLLNAPDAVIKNTQPMADGSDGQLTIQQVAEPAADYYGGGKVSSEELATIEDMRLLERENLAHIRAVIRSLAASTDAEAK